MSFHYSVDNGITINRFSEDLRLIDMELPAAGFGAATGIHLNLKCVTKVANESRSSCPCPGKFYHCFGVF